jgi:hypothetical protein
MEKKERCEKEGRGKLKVEIHAALASWMADDSAILPGPIGGVK